MEPICITYAKQMLEVESLPTELYAKLIRAEKLIQKVRPGGCLGSTQVISAIILDWENSNA
jgi:hypothetical protein